MNDILRDVKVFIYFFASYFYCKSRMHNSDFIKIITKVLFGLVTLTILFCLIDFFQNGLNGLSDNKILRTFGLGLSQYGLAIAFLIFISCKKYIQNKIGIIGYYVFQILCFILCIVSYTRSVWIQLALSTVCYFLSEKYINISHKEKITIHKLIAKVFWLTLFCASIYSIFQYLVENYSQIVTLIITRMKSISAVRTGQVYLGNADTLTDRIDNILKYTHKLLSFRILGGWGFGDKLPEEQNGIIENSFIYYLWKYGLILFSMLVIKIIEKFRDIWKRNTKINRAVFISLFCYFISGGISGHLNKYYMQPFIAILLLIDFQKYLEQNEKKCGLKV